METAQDANQQSCGSRSLRGAGGRDKDFEEQAKRIDQHVPFTPLDGLARSKIHGAAVTIGLYVLTIEDCGGGPTALTRRRSNVSAKPGSDAYFSVTSASLGSAQFYRLRKS